jgi:hypothetical protein
MCAKVSVIQNSCRNYHRKYSVPKSSTGSKCRKRSSSTGFRARPRPYKQQKWCVPLLRPAFSFCLSLGKDHYCIWYACRICWNFGCWSFCIPWYTMRFHIDHESIDPCLLGLPSPIVLLPQLLRGMHEPATLWLQNNACMICDPTDNAVGPLFPQFDVIGTTATCCCFQYWFPFKHRHAEADIWVVWWNIVTV